MDSSLNYIIFWLILMIILFVAEAAIQGLVTLWFGVGAFVATLMAGIGLSLGWQLVGFVVVSLVCLLVIRRYAGSRIRRLKAPINTNLVIGKVGLVVETIDSDCLGKVVIGDIVWQARTKSHRIEKDEKVIVEDIQGNVIIVERKL